MTEWIRLKALNRMAPCTTSPVFSRLTVRLYRISKALRLSLLVAIRLKSVTEAALRSQAYSTFAHQIGRKTNLDTVYPSLSPCHQFYGMPSQRIFLPAVRKPNAFTKSASPSSTSGKSIYDRVSRFKTCPPCVHTLYVYLHI